MKEKEKLEWLAKRYAKDVFCSRCLARLSVCSEDGIPHKVRTACAARILEAVELAVQKAKEKK